MSINYRRAYFEGHMRDNSLNVVTYVRYPGKQIVFTGLHNSGDGPAGSSINFAEDIIASIAEKEGIDPREYTFYDLQTQKGYCGHEPGDYTFNKLRPVWEDTKIVHMAWREGHCSDVILHDFGGYIQGSNGKIPFRNLAQAYGAIRPLPKNHSVNTLEDMLYIGVLAKYVCERHDLTDLWAVFLKKFGELVKEFYRECWIDLDDDEQFWALPRSTSLDQTSLYLFCELCDWLVKQHIEFREAISPVLFFE